MLEYITYIWITVTVVSVMVEVITRDKIALCFAPAGVICTVLSILPFNIAFWVQTVAFFIATIPCLVTSIVLKHKGKRAPHKSNVK